jgi:hypothetical protein
MAKVDGRGAGKAAPEGGNAGGGAGREGARRRRKKKPLTGRAHLSVAERERGGREAAGWAVGPKREVGPRG